MPKKKIVDLEDRSRRNNLMVFGIPEAPGETKDSLRSKVLRDVFEEKLGIHVNTGRKTNKNRPVVVKFLDYAEKENVLKNRRCLKGTKITLEHDYSWQTIQKRKQLWETSKPNRDNGETVFLIHDKIKIGGQVFEWDDNVGQMCKEKNRPTRQKSVK